MADSPARFNHAGKQIAKAFVSWYDHAMDTIRILLISDSHRDTESLAFLKELYKDYDYRIHLGDSELQPEDLEGYLCVKGNHDDFPASVIPYQRILEAGNHRFYLCHGHKDFLRYYMYGPMVENARSNNCDTVLFGHVHVYQDTVKDGIRLLNPGSLVHNRDGTHPSYMLIEINDDGMSVQRMRYRAPSRMNEKKGLFERFLDWLAGRND